MPGNTPDITSFTSGRQFAVARNGTERLRGRVGDSILQNRAGIRTPPGRSIDLVDIIPQQRASFRHLKIHHEAAEQN